MPYVLNMSLRALLTAGLMPYVEIILSFTFHWSGEKDCTVITANVIFWTVKLKKLLKN